MPTHSRHRDTQARPQACMLTTTANNKLNVRKNETRRTLPVTAEYSMPCSVFPVAAGFEPTNVGVKVPCLTSWLRD